MATEEVINQEVITEDPTEEIQEEVSVEETTEETPTEEEEAVTEEGAGDAEEPVEEEAEQPEKEEEAEVPKLMAKIQTVFADREVEGELDYEEAAVTYIEELESELTEMNEANSVIVDIFNANDAVRGLMRDLVDGAELSEAIARNIDLDSVTPQEGDPDYKKWAAAKKSREDQQAERGRNAEMIRNNHRQSTQIFNEFATENELEPEDVRNILEKVDPMIADIAVGKVSKEFLNIIRKGLEYEKAVTKAKETGEKIGINKKIVAKKTLPKKGDNIPHPSSGGKMPTGTKEEKPKGWAGRALERFEDKQSF